MKNQDNDYTLKYIKEGDVCAEIGVWEGDLSVKILKRKPSMLHLIDPWKTQDVIERCYSANQERINKVYQTVSNKFRKLNNVEIHRAFSTQISFPEKYFNWVYVDGDHSYDGVKKDLEFYYPLIKQGGYLCGDDYGLWANNPKSGVGSDGGGGPKPAVDEFAKRHNLEIEVFDMQFTIFI